MNQLTHGKEIQSNKETFLDERKAFQYNGEGFVVVVKSSKRALLVCNTIAMYSCMQILDLSGTEIFHELYPSILTEGQAKRIIEKIESDPKPFIDYGESKSN